MWFNEMHLQHAEGYSGSWITLLFLCRYGAKEEKSAVILWDTVLCYQTVLARISIHPEGWEQAASEFSFHHPLLLCLCVPFSVLLLHPSLALCLFTLSKVFLAPGMPAQESINSRPEWTVCFKEGCFLSCRSSWRHRSRVPDLHPARRHDIPQVGGTHRAKRSHHTVWGKLTSLLTQKSPQQWQQLNSHNTHLSSLGVGYYFCLVYI